MTTTFTAPAISCGGCARNVKAVLSRTAGVTGVDVHVPGKQVAITFDAGATSADHLAAVLTEAGYPPQPAPAGA